MPHRRPFHLATDRLTVRMMSRDDVTAFTHYRKLPDVARYQDWPMPYTRDLAHELVDEMERLGGPTADEWVQLAIESADGLIGDVAVWLDADTTLAMIGYTLEPTAQGRGYATEAVEAVIAWLFRHRRVHRIAGHPGITVSYVADAVGSPARFYERLGFVPTGRVDDGETEARLDLSG